MSEQEYFKNENFGKCGVFPIRKFGRPSVIRLPSDGLFAGTIRPLGLPEGAS
jgi:hypothetical protein